MPMFFDTQQAGFFSPIMDDDDVIQLELQRERNRFRQLIADAIVRPKNVIPDSCAEFIGLDDLEQAEERAFENEQRRKDMEAARKKQIELERRLGPPDHPELFPDY